MGGLKGFRTGGLLRFLPLCVIFVVFMENISCKMVKEGHKQLAWGVMLPTYFLPTQQGNTPNWLPPGRHYPYHLEMVVPAIRIATEKVKREYLPGRNITVQIEDTKCDLENTQFQAAEMEVKFDKKVYAYFGPVCEYPVAPVSRFAKRWNIPLITVGAQAFTYHQARMIINFMPPHVHLGRFVYEIWEKYHWTRGVMLYHKNDKGMEDPFFMMGAVYKGLQLQGPMNFSNHGFDEFSNVDYTQILRKNVMPESRVVQCVGLPDGETIDLSVMLPKDPLPSVKSETPWLPEGRHYPYHLQMVMPAMRIAVEKVQETLITNHTIVLHVDDTHCWTNTAQLAAADIFIKHRVMAFFGPVCEYAVSPVGRFAAHWNVPQLTAGGQAQGYFQPPFDVTLTNVMPPHLKLGNFVGQIFLRYEWTRGIFLYHDGDNNIRDTVFMTGPVYTTVRQDFRLNVTHKDFNEYLPGLDYAEILEKVVRPTARVVIICASGDAVRKLMLAAHRLGMTDGSYAFFNIVLFDSTYFGNIGWKRDDEHDEEAKAAYRALMTFTLHNKKTPLYEEFALEVKERAMAEFNFSYDSIGEEVNSFVGAFHDAVLLYAMALNETLEDPEGDPRDGASVTKRMWNRTFTGISGEISIDEKGDRDADYSLLEMTDTENGTFEVIGVYYGAKRVYKPVAGKVIDWPGSEVPPDIPKCGFLNELCPPPNNSPTTLLIMGSMAVIILSAVGIILYVLRKYRLERELSNMSWRIRWEDISFNNKGDKMRKLGGSRMSFGSGNTQDSGQSVWGNNQQIFTVTGFYKGIVIAIKRVNRQRVELNRNVLMEIKYVRDLQHDHVIKFIGACIDAPNISIMTEYCPKGSLQDILENESIELDELFKYSLMYDIVKGMIYLHSSVICTHGNLKSSNCVVDSRFVLKITDFGLNSFREPDHPFEPTEEDSYKYYQRRLWTAPELLRLPEIPTGGTQKGDVYSFGIILQEIMYREGVFYIKDVDLMPEEIVKKVANGYKPPFRPTIDRVTCSQEMMDLIRDCWAEDPADRTDFRELRGIMRKLNKNSENKGLVDTLLSRMEQYASNLESLVQERTEAFYEEKRKAEELLYQILPRPIAEELKNGKPVTAESFECVTIYFSDIVGFTKLSSDSTPLEVVDLLNDLYTCFDAIIDNFNVYKVETIGDAYMVVSGLPIRNGDFHAREIARMSLALLNEITTFRIRHRPDERLRLRIGVHTGPVVAGVVGLKMPRYCLFGDTVNTASRMESNGEAMKIHISEHTKKILDLFGTFVLELRGEVEMKGKGKQTTYWLKGELKGQNGICDLKYQEITV